jgi:hypothetical protein
MASESDFPYYSTQSKWFIGVRGSRFMKNRRKISDRRCYIPMQLFPFTDKNGCFLRESRSRAPDRRLNNLKVEWVSMALVHDELVMKRKVDPVGVAIKAAPREKRVKG